MLIAGTGMAYHKIRRDQAAEPPATGRSGTGCGGG